MELAPVPGLPICPAINARLMIAWAVRVDSCPWFTPMVHQYETRGRVAMRSTSVSNNSSGILASAHTFSGVNPLTAAANASKPRVCASMNARSTAPRRIRAEATP